MYAKSAHVSCILRCNGPCMVLPHFFQTKKKHIHLLLSMSHSLTCHGCCLSFWQAASIVESLMNLHPILLALCMPASAFFRKNFQTKYGTGPLQCQHQLFSEKTSKQNMVLDLFKWPHTGKRWRWGRRMEKT